MQKFQYVAVIRINSTLPPIYLFIINLTNSHQQQQENKKFKIFKILKNLSKNKIKIENNLK
jgi:hypothetical protein